jgi:chromosome segregation ATPase
MADEMSTTDALLTTISSDVKTAITDINSNGTKIDELKTSADTSLSNILTQEQGIRSTLDNKDSGLAQVYLNTKDMRSTLLELDTKTVSEDKFDSQLAQVISGIQTLTNVVNSNFDTSNKKLDILEASLTSTNQKVDSLKSSVDESNVQLSNLNTTLSKVLVEVAKLLGDDETISDTSTKTEDQISKAQAEYSINQAKASSSKSFYWNHKMTESAKATFDSAGCTITQPDSLGGQYLITMK